jgi:hypothetical protein
MEKSIAAKIPENERFAIFPKTRAQIDLKAVNLPAERCADALPQKISLDEYQQAVLKDPASHRTPEASRSIFANTLHQKMLQEALRKAGTPEELQPVIVEHPVLQDAVTKCFNQHIVPDMNLVRRRIAEKQRTDYWPALVSGVWLPDMAAVESFYQSDRKTVPASLNGRPPQDDQLFLAETHEMINQLIIKRLQKEVTFLENQQKQTKHIYDTLLNEVSRLNDPAQKIQLILETFSLTRDDLSVEQIALSYQGLVQRQSVAENLFPMVIADIQVRSLAILQMIQNEMKEQERREKQEKIPEESREDSEMQKKISLEFSIGIKESGNNFIVYVNTWQQSGSKADAAKLGDNMLNHIRKTLQEAAGPGIVIDEIKVQMAVNGPEIRYQFVAQLREKLKQVLGEQIEIQDFYGN